MGKSIRGILRGEVKMRLPEEILEKIDAIAAREFTTRSEIMRRACVEFVEREKKPVKENPGQVAPKFNSASDREDSQSGESHRKHGCDPEAQ